MPTLRWIARSTLERSRDWRIGARTFGYYTAEQLGLEADGRAYEPAPYRLTCQLLDMVPAEFRHRGFLDFGCGLGRVLCLARRAGFNPVVGMEIAPNLAAMAQAQLSRLGITVVQGNARDLTIPSAVRVFFLFNPFIGLTLNAVITNILVHARDNGECLLLAITCRSLAPCLKALAIPAMAHGGDGNIYDWAMYRIAVPHSPG